MVLELVWVAGCHKKDVLVERFSLDESINHDLLKKPVDVNVGVDLIKEKDDFLVGLFPLCESSLGLSHEVQDLLLTDPLVQVEDTEIVGQDISEIVNDGSLANTSLAHYDDRGPDSQSEVDEGQLKEVVSSE